MADLFDRRIDLTFYSENNLPIAVIKTPEIGPKPEIKIEGVILNAKMSISSKVTITNLERSIDIDSVSTIEAECYYGGSSSLQALKKKFVFQVLWADQSKQPPDRQVCFNCLTAGFSPSLASSYITIKAKQNADGELVPYTLEELCDKFVLAYNKAVSQQFGTISMDLALSGTLYTNAEAFRTAPIFINEGTYSLFDFLDFLSSCTRSKTLIAKGYDSQYYYPLNVFVDDNKLNVVRNPSYDNSYVGAGNRLKLEYVSSAYRKGPIVYVQSLFDPRISQSCLMVLPTNAIYGRQTLRGIVNIPSKEVMFYPIAGIQYVFSTTTENYMKFQGCVLGGE